MMPFDDDNQPYCVVYDCGLVDYIAARAGTKSIAKINRKQIQHLYDKKLMIKKVQDIRRSIPLYKQDFVIVGLE